MFRGNTRINIKSYDHGELMREDINYFSLIRFIEENEPVDDMDERLDPWCPMKFPNRNGPLTIAETFTKAIVWDQDNHVYCRSKSGVTESDNNY